MTGEVAPKITNTKAFQLWRVKNSGVQKVRRQSTQPRRRGRGGDRKATLASGGDSEEQKLGISVVEVFPMEAALACEAFSLPSSVGCTSTRLPSALSCWACPEPPADEALSNVLARTEGAAVVFWSWGPDLHTRTGDGHQKRMSRSLENAEQQQQQQLEGAAQLVFWGGAGQGGVGSGQHTRRSPHHTPQLGAHLLSPYSENDTDPLGLYKTEHEELLGM